MSVDFERLKERLFNPDNHSLEDIESIEKELIKLLLDPNIDNETKSLIKITRKDAKKKYLLCRFPPSKKHVSPRVASILREAYEDKKDKDKGLLD